MRTATSSERVPGPGATRAAGRRGLRWLLPVLGVVAATVVLTLLAPATNRLPLDPDSVAGDGARAVAQVLQRQGVRVERATRLDDVEDLVRSAGGRASVLVTRPDDPTPQRLEQLAALDADLVLLAPTGESVATLVPGLRAAGSAERTTADPRCASPDAAAAGRAAAGGQLYARSPGSADTATRVLTCYPLAAGASYAEVPAPDGRRVTVFGQPAVLTNDLLDEEGNAALALRALGRRPLLVWYSPGALDSTAPGEAPPLAELAPAWLLPAAAVLGLSALLVVATCGRRLGRLVPEPLPVVVRAAETVEGRGRLYARAGARDRAAQALRAGTVRRCRQRLRLGRGTGGPTGGCEVADAVAAATGRPQAQVRALLDGGPPADDAALVRLAADLDLLERHLAAGPAPVRAPAPPQAQHQAPPVEPLSPPRPRKARRP